MAFGIGVKTLLAYCRAQNVMNWHKAKLSVVLFKQHEQPMFEWVESHLSAHHALPKEETLVAKFPDMQGIDTPEPASYYTDMLEKQFYYGVINTANISSQQILQANQDDYQKSIEVLQGATHQILMQRMRQQVLNVGKEGAHFVTEAYHNVALIENISKFGWPYMDNQCGGGMPGDIISFVGRPAAGKTWLMIWIALYNWIQGNNVLLVSMEMGLLPIAQRITSIYTHCSVTQLKTASFSKQTYDKFQLSVKGMAKEPGNMYVVNGKLAANMEDIYMLADQLQCMTICIDGAYLVRHKNAKLDRFNRVAENCELMKSYNENLMSCTFSSWQFNRDAVSKSKKSGKQETNLEDIGYSDAIGQISSIACGMFQEEGVETMLKRTIRLMKGRNGEIGQFDIAWDFGGMNFNQVNPVVGGDKAVQQQLQWI